MRTQNVTVVIRGAGERTEWICQKIVEQQVAEEQIFIIRESPFRKAVEKNFKIGIEQDREWTLAVDADIYLRDHAIRDMVEAASKLEDTIFIYQGIIWDKIYRAYRYGGPHLYRTQWLPKALKLIPQEDEVLRPESGTYKRMAALGHTFYNDETCFGTHEYDQYFKDYFRKGFFHAKKTPDKFLEELLSKWSTLMEDPEYSLIMSGFLAGKQYSGSIPVDIHFFDKLSLAYLKLLNIKERSPLNQYSGNPANKILADIEVIGPTNHKLPKPFFLDKEGKMIYVPSKSSSSKIPLEQRIRNGIGRRIVSLGNKVLVKV